MSKALAVVCVAALAWGPAAATSARANGFPSVTSGPYGLIASNANFMAPTVQARAAQYRRLYDAGVRVVRIDIRWTDVQPVGSAPDHFDFTERDREVAAIRAAGLKIIGILCCGNPDYSKLGAAAAQSPLSGGIPPFSVGSAILFPPDNPADFARYARATTQHYAGAAVGWEVWNEENSGYRFWEPHEDPAAYARLLCATYTQIKAVDPQTPVLFGGVFFPAVAGAPGTSGPDFAQGAYAANPGVGRCFDAMAYHPYPYPFTAPELDVPVRGSVLAAADAMRGVLTANGDGAKPLWITEIGWPTHDLTYGVPEEKQGQYVSRMLAATFAQNIPVLTFYTYGDGVDPTGGANQESWFGFFRPDDSPKPSYVALRTFAQVFAGTHFVTDRSAALGLPAGQQNVGGRGFALVYRRPGATITAAWLASESAGEAQGRTPAGGTASPPSIPLALPVASPTVTIIDWLGHTRQVDASMGKVNLRLGPGPQYVVDLTPEEASQSGGRGVTLAGTSGIVALPPARAMSPTTGRNRCGSRRHFVIHLRPRHGLRVTGLSVFINGRLVRRVRGSALHTLIDLRGLPRGTVHVGVVVHAISGPAKRPHSRVLMGRRTYHTCVRGPRRAHG